MSPSVAIAAVPGSTDSVLALSEDHSSLVERSRLAHEDVPVTSAVNGEHGQPLYKAVHIICNPQAGRGKAQEVLSSLVLPLFARLGIQPDLCLTSSAQEATDYGARVKSTGISSNSETHNNVLLVVLGGDGSLSALAAGLLSKDTQDEQVQRSNADSSGSHFTLAIIPVGTANALFHYFYPFHKSILASLAAALSPSSTPASLPALSVAITKRDGSAARSLGLVVASTALHASILHDSEALRPTIPGVDRFKRAAEQNWTRTYAGSLQLDGKTHVQQYDPSTQAFVKVGIPPSIPSSNWVYLNGLLSDRLEHNFIVAPKRTPECANKMDVVCIQRPDTDKVSDEAFSAALLKVVQAMYSGGTHVDLVWVGDELQPWSQESKLEDLAVKYWRCAGYTWTPVSAAVFSENCLSSRNIRYRTRMTGAHVSSASTATSSASKIKA